jgi:hypothetical protein
MTPAYAELLEQEHAWPPAVDLGDVLFEAPVHEPHWHAFNPWAERVVYVTLEELAACHRFIGCKVDVFGYWRLLTVDLLLAVWDREGEGNPLDAYLFLREPAGDGYPVAGVRYGPGPCDYFTPCCNREELKALLEKYGWKKR